MRAAPRRADAAQRAEFTLQCIHVLQCLSTFFQDESHVLSTLAFRMISDYTELSLSIVSRVMRFLAARNYVALSADGRAGRLDPYSWEERSRNGSGKRYFAYFVANAPSCLRDEDSLRAACPGACFVPTPEYTGGVTIAPSFGGVDNGFCPSLPPAPVENIFVNRIHVCPEDTGMVNLWYLKSAFYPEQSVLFRLQMQLLYLGGRDGQDCADMVERGDCVLLCISDQTLESESALDCIAFPSEVASLENFRTLSGHDLELAPALGTARFGAGDSRCRKLYRERGTTACGVRIIELHPGS
jgi:hypothetical protein